MNRHSFTFSLLILILIFSWRRGVAQTSIPVDHKEPITIHVVDAETGRSIPDLHLALIAGYDRADIKRQAWREDLMTDRDGAVAVPATLLNLPWMRVLLPKSSLCKADPRLAVFSVERMRNDGLSAPNRCGTVLLVPRAGEFTVFARGNSGRDNQAEAAASATASAKPRDSIAVPGKSGAR